MSRALSLEGRRLLELARDVGHGLPPGPLAESWDVIVEALARGWLRVDGADSVTALIAELESGGGLRVEDLAIEVSFDDPRGETVIVALGAQGVLASRSGLVRELRRLLRSFRGEPAGAGAAPTPQGEREQEPAPQVERHPAPAAVAGAAADDRAVVARAESEPEAAAEAASGDELRGEARATDERWRAAVDSAHDTVGAAKGDLRQALARIGAALKERLGEAAARSERGVGEAADEASAGATEAATRLRDRLQELAGAVRKAVHEASAKGAQGPSGGDVAPAAPHGDAAQGGAGASEIDDAAAEAAPGGEARQGFELLTELRKQLGAGPGQGEGRVRLADAVRRIGGSVGAAGDGGGKLAESADKLARWISDADGGGALVDSFLEKLGGALERARAEAQAARDPAPARRAPHLRLVEDEDLEREIDDGDPGAPDARRGPARDN